jgi:hypothetical protein
VPLLQGIRGAARFGYLVLFAVAGLAAFGLAALRAKWLTARPGLALVASFACLAAVNLEAVVAPIEYTRFDGIPPIYTVLADVEGAVVVDLPLPDAGRIARNAPVVLVSTAHWRPVVNGYSGFVPRGYAARAERLATFPSPDALAELRRLGVTHVVVRLDAVPGAPELAARPDFVTVASSPALRIYRLRQP